MRASDFFPFRHQIREGTRIAIDGLTPEQLEWKPPGGVHSILGWLRHVAQAEDWWVRRVILGEAMTPKRKVEVPDLESVMAYLEETWARTNRLLEEWPAEKLQEIRPIPPDHNGPPIEEAPIHWIIQTVFNHGIHHRAQIRLYRRLMGVPAAPSW